MSKGKREDAPLGILFRSPFFWVWKERNIRASEVVNEDNSFDLIRNT